MPRKGMKSIFSASPNPSKVSSSSSLSSSTRGFMASIMAQTLEQADPFITKWDVDSSNFAKLTSLFYENRREAKIFVRQVNDLQSAMHSLVKENPNSQMLVRAQKLMQIAMKRLQKEFYQILSLNRALLDPESVSTRSSLTSTSSRSSLSADQFGSVSHADDMENNHEIRVADKLISDVENAAAVVMADLKLIAECMISNGYGKECVGVYISMRKSIVDEGIFKLGVDKEVNPKKMQKMDWEILDLKIQDWLGAVKVAVETLFHGERILCDQVFASSNSLLRESCFNEITKDGATTLFGFPENVMKNKKKSSVRPFRTLDMYTAIANHWPEIESIFSTSPIVNLALNSIVILGASVRSSLTEFESSIHKESSKTTIAGAGVHNLTNDVMDFLSSLADYNVLGDILIDSPPPEKSSLPQSCYDAFISSEEYSYSPASLKFAWLILSLIYKMDRKAEHYKDVSKSYLFLANNLQHIVYKVRTSNLRYFLGDDWISKHESKVKTYAANYERVGWNDVIESVPANPTALTSPENIKESFKRFNAVFEEVQRKQSGCVVPDSKLRDEIKASIAEKLLPLYREFYNTHVMEMRKEKSFAQVVKFTPDNLTRVLTDLFLGSGSSFTSFSASFRRLSSRS